MNERTILITGSTDGLGRETARRLAAAGATVLLHGRDARRAIGQHETRDESGGRVTAGKVHLSSVPASSVR